jgi:SnoaL-like domain
MNRREAIIAGVAGITGAVAVAPTADAQASEGANPDLDQIRALLRAHDEAFTNHDLNGVMACFTEKAAIMGTGPGEIWSAAEAVMDSVATPIESKVNGVDKMLYMQSFSANDGKMVLKERTNAGKRYRRRTRPDRPGKTIQRARAGSANRSEAV